MKFFNVLKAQRFYLLLYLLGVIILVAAKFNFHTGQTNDQNYSFNYEIGDTIAEVIDKTYSLNDTQIIITFDTSNEKILEYEYEQKISEKEKIYTKKTISDRSYDQPFVKSERLPLVRGVLVSVSDVNDSEIYDIRRAVATLLGISVNKVNVICGKG